MFPGEFECVYYYTSRYSKCLEEDDYVEYSNSIITDDCIVVDLCGSGWSLEKFSKNLNCKKVDVFFIQKMQQDREYMKEDIVSKCVFHSVVENDPEKYRNHILEIANFATHPMLRSIKKIDGNFCPIFFPETRTETEFHYISLQNDIMDQCIEGVKNGRIDPFIYDCQDEILSNVVKIFYQLMSQDIFLHAVYSINFFQENSYVENKLAALTKNKQLVS